jgi:methyl-accepting chemotaxis protein
MLGHKSSYVRECESKLAAMDKVQAVIEFNLDGTIITANQNFLDALGYRLEEIKGKHHSMFADPAYAASPEYRAFWDKLRSGEFDAGQYKRIGKGGKEIWIQASYNPMFDAHGKPYKVIKFATDMTADKMRNAEFEGLITAFNRSQAVIEFQLDGTIITANENFLNTLGYRLEEIKGKHHSMFADPAYAASAEYRAFWDKLRSGQFDAAQYKRIGKGGKEVWIQASYNPIFDPSGRPYKVVKFATDISGQVNQLRTIKSNMGGNLGQIEDAVNVVSQQTTAASGAATQTTSNVHSVASGAEELHASVVEISQNMTKSQHAADQAYAKVKEADEETRKLLSAAEAMNGIVNLIDEIASQVNLLSLNATIEAARAGEAGKGFAVVASEVKNLAGQVAEATKNIGTEIDGIQNVVSIVAKSLQEILGSIEGLRSYVTGVAGAVEEQSAVAKDMSSNMQSAAQAVNDINARLADIVSAVHTVNAAVDQSKAAANSIVD